MWGASEDSLNTAPWSTISSFRMPLPRGRLTRDESEGDRIDATTTTAISSRGGLWTLRGAYVHLEADRLLEDGGAAAGLVLGPEAGLRQHTVTQAGDLRQVGDKRRGDSSDLSPGNG